MARGPVAVGIPGWTTALAGTEGTRVQGESEYRCTMGRQAARRPQSTGTRPAADAGRLESTITSTLRLVSEPGSRSDRCRNHRSEEHTSELQSLMPNSYAVFFLKNNI